MFGKKSSNIDVREGLTELFPRLWRYAFVLTSSRDRADDLAQAVCLRAIEKAEQFQAGTHLDRWLFKMTQNIWYNELRKTAVRVGGGLVPVEEIDIADIKMDPETNLLGREVLLGVMALPEAQRATVMLAYVEGYSYREISELLEIPVGTVMSRLAAARAKLNERFGETKNNVTDLRQASRD